MKKTLFLLTFVLALACNLSVVAQEDNDNEDSRARFEAEKIAFFTDRLNITPEEAQDFWPLYNDFEGKRWEIQRSRRGLERKVDDGEEMSEREVIQLTRDIAANRQEEANLYAEYNEKFLEVLPPHKVLGLYNAENEFNMYMIRRYRDRGRD